MSISARTVEEIINDLSVILSVVHVDTTRPNIEQTVVFQAIDMSSLQLLWYSWSVNVILIVLLLTKPGCTNCSSSSSKEQLRNTMWW